jgi:5-methylcytosine-specific restriction endonuclease McrA
MHTNPGGQCDAHKQQQAAEHNQARTYYHTGEWAQLRAACLARDYRQCVICARTHRLTAHHIKARKDGGPDTLTNLTTLCHTCHSKIEQGDTTTTNHLAQHLNATRRTP